MFLTAAEIKQNFNFSLADSGNDEPINFAIKSAAFDLSDRVSPENYALAKGNAPTDHATAEFIRYERLVQAHAYLTVSLVYLNNTQIRAAGNVSTERDENNATTSSYLSPAQLKSLREQYLAEAEKIIAKFAVIPVAPTVNRAISQSVPIEIGW